MSKHSKTLSAIFPFFLRIDEGKTFILLSRRQNTGYQDGKWDIAGGGHVDEGELATSAVIRECKEELGIDVNIDDLQFIHLCHRFSNRVYYDIYFLVTKYSGNPSIMEPDKCSELSWFDMDNLPNDIVECRKSVIQEYKNRKYYSERVENKI